MKKSFIFSVIMVFLICMVGCSPKPTNINTTGEKTSRMNATDPTGPTADSRVTLWVPVLLKDILGSDLKDVNAITIIKYENNVKMTTVSVSDEKKIAEITNAILAFSVIHTKEKLPESSVVYEIYFSPTTYPQGFLSITSLANKNEFAVAGSFISYNNLVQTQVLMQNNSKISFGDMQKILEDSF